MSGRMSMAFAYITAFASWIIFWWIGVYVIEFLVNVILSGIVRIFLDWAGIYFITIPVLNLPTPFELLTWAISQFPGLWNIGNTIFWGFIEEIAFMLWLVFGVLGELTSATKIGTPIRSIATFLNTVTTSAAGKRSGR